MSRKKSRGRPRTYVADTPGARALHGVLTDLGLSATDLALIAGVHPTAAQRWLYGIRPSEGTAQLLVLRWPDRLSMDLWGYE